MNKYVVNHTSNPFYGRIFNGSIHKIDDEIRIWDNDGFGRSYPETDCLAIDYDL